MQAAAHCSQQFSISEVILMELCDVHAWIWQFDLCV
jgi:hypothetical protein